MAAGSVSKRASGPGKRGHTVEVAHANRSRKHTSAITSDDLEHRSVLMGLFSAGKGIFPSADGKRPRKSKVSAHVSMKVVAQRVVERLKLPRPVIRTSPREDFVQVVHVPTWMWVERRTWAPVSTSAAVDGVEVTATARPRKAVWSMGDGGVVECRGPGTPYSDSYGPKASSPDCGYTYQRGSLGEPKRAFTVSVRVTWDVEWHGNGQTGRVPGLVMAAERQLVVDEVQSVVTR
ncbi:hypothetical protein [Streptomyces sp. ISID311]|uniref:hypothetical protein n=1 Tax=Streptomyces sp. ISID311 TaxID=2601673 RepID=UPI0021C3F6F6|nr:hypothetical protein [Streptomyces sp. ISID311]